MEKILKALWFTTLLLVFGLLMYVFASLPEQVFYSEVAALSRDQFFYVALGIILLVNFSLYTMSRKFKAHTAIGRSVYGWLFSLGLVLNGFLFIAMQYINLYNSGEQVRYDYYGYYLYICLVLLVFIIIALPVLILKNIKK